MVRIAVVCAAALLAGVLGGPGPAGSQSPYAAQEAQDIKALSPREVSDLLAGEGMGLARAAELNGYPGPAHVLQLAESLRLDPEQRAKTEALFRKVKARAADIGRQLVEQERALDRLFSSRSMTPAVLASQLERIGSLQSELRRVHLETHLEQTALLSDTQIATYSRLRGYGGGGHPGHGRRH